MVGKGFIFDDDLWIAWLNVWFIIRGGRRQSEWGEGGCVIQLGFDLSNDCQELLVGCYGGGGGRRGDVDGVDVDGF
jgi:hypothetical protein